MSKDEGRSLCQGRFGDLTIFGRARRGGELGIVAGSGERVELWETVFFRNWKWNRKKKESN